MTSEELRLRDLADHFWYLAERAEANGETKDVVETHQHRAVFARIAADFAARRETKA
jgi:hypothetical protein